MLILSFIAIGRLQNTVITSSMLYIEREESREASHIEKSSLLLMATRQDLSGFSQIDYRYIGFNVS